MNERKWRWLAVLALAVLAGGLGACAGPDPWERMNRGTFWFNERFDDFLLEPASRGWDWAMPETAQTGVRNFFTNLRFPIVFLNNLMQLKPLDAGEDLSRFIVNTTVGVLGFVDVASKIDVPKNEEDFDQTLGSYGVPMGPYLVLPILGPSSPRGTVGLVGDTAASPQTWLLHPAVNVGVRAVDVVNLRAYYHEEIAQARRDNLDYYIFVRDAYLSNRQHRVNDREEGESDDEEDDLYFLDEEELE